METDDSWDAETYDRISSNFQLERGIRLLERRDWTGSEIVMDAGAGSGNLTRILAGKVPMGFVYAVDADENMVRQAKANLSDCQNAQVIHSDMRGVNLPRAVDVIFSNAAIHWVAEQERLFFHFMQLLKPSGELLAEFGGHGNLERVLPLVFEIIRSDQFREYFVNWKQPWYFPTTGETEKMLRRAGFRDVKVSHPRQTITFPDRESFAKFVKTVILKAFLAYLPAGSDRDRLLDAFLREVERSGSGWSLDYVRIGVLARR